MLGPVEVCRPGHRHEHVHDRHRADGSCSCRGCRYSGDLTDVLKLKDAVQSIRQSGGTGGAEDEAKRTRALMDELDNFHAHRSPFAVHA